MNNKGFTLVELLATLVILAIVMGIGTYSIISIMNSSRQKNYDFVISNIKDSAETLYQECKYIKNSSINCVATDNGYMITLGELVQYGYIKGNETKNDGSFTIINPKDEKDISTCEIEVYYDENIIKVKALNQIDSGSCPTTY